MYRALRRPAPATGERSLHHPTTSAADHAQHEQEDDRADERDEDRARETAERRRDAERAEQPAADEGADDADDDVTDQAVADSAHHERGEQSGDESDDEPSEQRHIGFSWRARRTVAPGRPPQGQRPCPVPARLPERTAAVGGPRHPFGPLPRLRAALNLEGRRAALVAAP